MANKLINTPIMEDIIGAELPNKIKFAPLAIVNNKLEKVAGDTIVVGKYTYIGDAEDVGKGQAIPVADLSQTSQKVTIKKAGKGVELTAEDLQLRGESELVGETKSQLEKSILNKVDTDCFEALCSTSVTVGDGTSELTYENIVDAKGAFEDEDDERAILFIAPSQKTAILKNGQFLPKKDMSDDMLLRGVIGEIGGCQVVVAKKLDTLAKAGVISNLIVKAGALGIELAKKPTIKVDESAKTDTTGYFITQMYVSYLRNEGKCVKVLAKAPTTAVKKSK